MTTKQLHKSSISLALSLMMAIWGISPVFAVPVTATITGDVDTVLGSNPFGLAVNDTVTAVALYDDSQVSELGESFIEIDSNPTFSLTLTFGSVTLVETDDFYFGTGFPGLGFTNGALDDIDFESDFFDFGGSFDLEVVSLFDEWEIFGDEGDVYGSWDFENAQIGPTGDSPPSGNPIPEPSTILLLGSGLVGLLGWRVRSRRNN